MAKIDVHRKTPRQSNPFSGRFDIGQHIYSVRGTSDTRGNTTNMAGIDPPRIGADRHPNRLSNLKGAQMSFRQVRHNPPIVGGYNLQHGFTNLKKNSRSDLELVHPATSPRLHLGLAPLPFLLLHPSPPPSR